MKIVYYRYVCCIIIITYEIINKINSITIKSNNINNSYNSNRIQQVLAFASTYSKVVVVKNHHHNNQFYNGSPIPKNTVINLQEQQRQQRQQQRRQQQWKHYATLSKHQYRDSVLSYHMCFRFRYYSTSFISFKHSSSHRLLEITSTSSSKKTTTTLAESSSSSPSSNRGNNDSDDENNNNIVESISTITESSSISVSLFNTIQLLKDNTDLITIIVIYFVEGALGISRLAQTLLLKDELHLGPAEMSAISGIFVIPWTIKPLYGFLSDSVPLFGYKRKSYLILAGIIGTISYTLLGFQGKLWDINTISPIIGTSDTTTAATVSTVLTDITNTVSSTVTPIVSSSSSSLVSSSVSLTIILLLVSSACIAFSDVVADGIIVAKSRLLATTATTSTIVEPVLEPVIASTVEPIIENKLLSIVDVDIVDDVALTTTTNNNKNGNSASLQSLCWGASAIGSLLSAYFSGSILQVLTPREVFGVTAILPFAVAAIATTIQEQPVTTTVLTSNNNNENSVLSTTTAIEQSMNDLIDLDSSLAPTTTTTTTATTFVTKTLSLQETILQQVLAVKDAFTLPQIWKPTLFLFLWQSTPTAGGAFLYFIINDLHISTDALGRLQFATAISTLVGVILYNRYLQNISIKSILIWTTLLSLPLGIIPPILLITHLNRDYNIPDMWLLYGDDVVLAALGQIGFLPTLVIAAKLCPPGIEAVLFATLMSIYNLAGTVGTEIGAILTKILGITESNFDNLILLTIICNVTSIWPLLLINWLNDVDTDTTTENDVQIQE